MDLQFWLAYLGKGGFPVNDTDLLTPIELRYFAEKLVEQKKLEKDQYDKELSKAKASSSSTSTRSRPK